MLVTGASSSETEADEADDAEEPLSTGEEVPKADVAAVALDAVVAMPPRQRADSSKARNRTPTIVIIAALSLLCVCDERVCRRGRERGERRTEAFFF